MMTVGRRGEASPSSSSGSQLSSSPSHSSSSGPAPKQICISVVGLSGTERDKGAIGVGKSCLCNRFVRPLEDEYHTDHISTLSQVDFSGSPVINNDHWLYWGERAVVVGAEPDLSGHRPERLVKVLEQTEFVDDECFQTIKATGPHQKEHYVKRASAIKLQSPDKLMYICKDQLGLETEYEQRPLVPEGKTTVDGFLCVFDVSLAHKRPFEQQASFLIPLLSQICKVSKKPLLLATTKHDEASPEGIREFEKLCSRKEIRGYGVQTIETSAHRNVNVEAAFIILSNLIDKLKAKPKISSFKEGIRERKQTLENARAAYLRKLKLMLPQHEWPNRRANWQQLLAAGLATDEDFVIYCDLYGRAQAQRLFKQYIKELRDDWMRKRLHNQASRLPEVIMRLLPEINAIRGNDWAHVLQWLQTHPQFEQFFQPPGSLGAEETGGADSTPNDDPRIPAELLFTPEAETVFKNHINSLEAQLRQQRLRDDFSQLLVDCTQVTPGKPLSDVRIFFLGKDCFETLPDVEVQEIYEQYQRGLVKRARESFVELLLEHVELFASKLLARQAANSSHTMPGLNENDMAQIHDKLQEDYRYRQLNRLFEARENMICQYASFVSYPLRQHCPARNRCIDSVIEQILASHLPQSRSTYGLTMENGSYESYTTPEKLNLLVLGTSGLPEQLVGEIRLYLPQDLYQCKGSGSVLSLNYRCVDGDVRDPSNSLTISSFVADSLVLVFSSRQSLDYLRDSLAQALLSVASDAQQMLPPTAVIVACDPNHLDDLPYLQQQGSLLAESLRAPFIRVGSSKTSPGRMEMSSVGTGPILFSSDQISCLLEHASANKPPSTCSSIAPDLRLHLCLMCGDSFSPHTVLGPLLSRRCSSNNTASNVFTFETFLPAVARKIRVETRVLGYHTALLSAGRAPDGVVLAFSTKRRASLAHASAVGRRSGRGRLLLLAVGEVAEFFSDKQSNALITEANALADRLGARFGTVSPAAEQQVGTYTPFLESILTEDKTQGSEYASLTEFQSGYWLASSETEPVVAPLATPEHIEVGVEYMCVKDALSRSSDSEQLYATLDSVHKPRAFTSDSSMQLSSGSDVGSSLDKPRTRSPSPYDKVGRKPTPHKRRQKSSGAEASSPTPKPGAGIAERLKLLNQDFMTIVPGGGAEIAKAAAEFPSTSLPPFPRSASEESLLLPSKHRQRRVRSSESGDDLILTEESRPRSRARSKGFVRKVASSFRFRRSSSTKKRSVEDEDGPTLFAVDFSEAARPRTGSSGCLLSPNSQPSTGWLKSPKKERPDSDKKLPSGYRRSSAEAQMKKKGSASNLTSLGVVPPGSCLADLAAGQSDMVPVFVKKCVEFIENEGGLTTEGLYRIPGNQAQVSQLEAKFLDNPSVSLRELDAPLNAVATALKNFFSYLSAPVIPNYELWLEHIPWDGGLESKLDSIQSLLARLPPENKATLRYFMAHLERVASCCQQTAMDHKNLAKCWWPTLLRPDFSTFEHMAQRTPQLEEMTQLLLQHWRRVLG